MIKSILIAVDDSKASQAALTCGIWLAKTIGAKVKGLYVEDVTRLLEWEPVELMGAAIGATSIVPHVKPTIEEVEIEKQFIEEYTRLEELFKTTCKNASLEESLTGSFLKKRGKVSELVYDEAKTVDLLVIGRRGQTYPTQSKEPGPIAEFLLRNTTKPVLVVPPDAQLTGHMLIAYDGSKSAQRALAIGATLASLENFEVRVLSIADDIETADKPLTVAKQYLSSYNLKTSYVVGFGEAKPWKEILEQAKNFKAGMIVVGAFGDNKLLELLFGSTTKEVLMESTCPVLLCK